MDAEMTKYARSRMTHEDGTLRDVVTETPHWQASVPLAICGEPVVGRALELLLRGPRYSTRFVSISSSGEVASLEGVRLLLLAPTPGLSVGRREALLASLGKAAAMAGIPMLELATFSERAKPRHTQIPWPCSAEQLKRRIEAVLLARPCEVDQRECVQTCGPGER